MSYTVNVISIGESDIDIGIRANACTSCIVVPRCELKDVVLCLKLCAVSLALTNPIPLNVYLYDNSHHVTPLIPFVTLG